MMAKLYSMVTRNLDRLIREQVKIRQNGGSEKAYDQMVGALNSIADVAKGLKIPESSIPAGSTSGSVNTLVRDMVGFVETTVNTVMDTIIAADSIVALPSNLGRAYNEPLAHQNFTF